MLVNVLKWWWSPEGLMFASWAISFVEKWLVEVLFQPDDGLHDAADIAIRLCHSLKLFALLATPQAVKDLPMQQRCEYSTVLRLSEEPEQAEYRIE